MRRTNQGGSVLGFILVASALALILIGALYVVRQQSQQRQQTTPQSTSTSTPAPANNTPAPTPNKTAPAQQSGGSTNKKAATSVSSTDGATADALPHTGPSETLTALIAVGFLSWSVIAYTRSRRVVVSF